MSTKNTPAHSRDSDSSLTTCPECSGTIVTEDREKICQDCGIVTAENRIDHGPEWRTFEDDTNSEQRVRTGSPLTAARHDRGLNTKIGRHTDGNGNALKQNKKRRLCRMRKHQSQSRWQSKQDRNLADGLGEVRRMCSALGLGTSVRDQACQLFRTAQNAGLLPGRSIESVASASVYGTCRCNGRSMLMNDIVPVSQVCESRIQQAYSVLNRELGLPTEVVTPSQYVPRIISENDLSRDIREDAMTLVKEAEESGIANGVAPSGVAAACVYIAARERGAYVSQTDVGEVVDTSSTTVRKRRDEILEQSI